MGEWILHMQAEPGCHGNKTAVERLRCSLHSQLFSVKNLRRSSSESPDFQALDHEIFWRRQQVVVVRHTPLRASMIQVTVKPQTIDAPVTTHRHTQGHVAHGSALYIGSKREWVSEQCFTSPPTQYRLYGRRFLQVKKPNQQYQSTEGRSTKDKENN